MEDRIPSIEASRLSALLHTPWGEGSQPLMRFLRFERMIILYYLLLAVSRSRSDLKRIHDTVMPSNCRLLREDFVELERVWQVLYPKGKRPNSGMRVDDNVLAVMFSSLQGMDGVGIQTGLSGYYRKALYDGRPNLDSSAGYDGYANRVYIARADAEEGGHPRCFVGEIFHKRFEVEIQLSEDRKRLGVRFYYWQLALDEPFTRSILSLTPPYRGMSQTLSSGEGMQLALCWELPSDAFLPLLEETVAQPSRPLWPSFYAKPEFVEAVNKGLSDLGLPARVVQRIG